MSVRSHFWLRVLGIVTILAAQFGPRIWSSTTGSSTPAPNAKVAAVDAR
jgi:hypothetical protein